MKLEREQIKIVKWIVKQVYSKGFWDGVSKYEIKDIANGFTHEVMKAGVVTLVNTEDTDKAKSIHLTKVKELVENIEKQVYSKGFWGGDSKYDFKGVANGFTHEVMKAGEGE